MNSCASAASHSVLTTATPPTPSLSSDADAGEDEDEEEIAVRSMRPAPNVTPRWCWCRRRPAAATRMSPAEATSGGCCSVALPLTAGGVLTTTTGAEVLAAVFAAGVVVAAGAAAGAGVAAGAVLGWPVVMVTGPVVKELLAGEAGGRGEAAAAAAVAAGVVGLAGGADGAVAGAGWGGVTEMAAPSRADRSAATAAGAHAAEPRTRRPHDHLAVYAGNSDGSLSLVQVPRPRLSVRSERHMLKSTIPRSMRTPCSRVCDDCVSDDCVSDDCVCNECVCVCARERDEKRERERFL